MYRQKHHEFCSEFYSVEKTIEVVVKIQEEETTIRIEALEDQKNRGTYSTRAYLLEEINTSLSGPQRSGRGTVTKLERYTVWVDYDLPWIDRETAEGALNQALGFLKERCD